MMMETPEKEPLPHCKPRPTDIVLRQSQKKSQSVIVTRIG